jgi:Flp pilus assembly protein TadG
VSVRWLTFPPGLPIGAGRRYQRGQGLVEFAMLVPVFLVILLGMLEFGFAFNHNLTLEYATREGARAGAAMADGSQKDTTACGNGTTLSAVNVDPLIIAAVQRVLESPGSMVDISQVQDITIYKVSNDGLTTGPSNVWTKTIGAGPNVPCVPSQKLDFSPGSVNWPVSSRTPGGAAPYSIGVSITYNYQFRSPLGGILRFFGGSGWSQLTMTDKTVMALEPTS